MKQLFNKLLCSLHLEKQWKSFFLLTLIMNFLYCSLQSIVTILSIFIASKYVFKKSVFKASLVIVLASISSAIAMKVHYNIEFNFISKLLHCLGGDFMVISLFGSLLFYVIRDTKIFKIITKGKE